MCLHTRCFCFCSPEEKKKVMEMLSRVEENAAGLEPVQGDSC